jgi:hypothetical protein
VKQIYAEFNDIAVEGVLPLTCSGSIKSISMLNDELRDGEEVLLTDGDLRVLARVYRRADGSWEAKSEWRFSANN